MAYGFGVHRCMGNHVAEMQLRILWEKILAKFPKIEVVGDVECLTSNYVSGIEKMPVRIPTWGFVGRTWPSMLRLIEKWR